MAGVNGTDRYQISSVIVCEKPGRGGGSRFLNGFGSAATYSATWGTLIVACFTLSFILSIFTLCSITNDLVPFLSPIVGALAPRSMGRGEGREVVEVEGISAAASRCRLHRSALDLHVRLLRTSSCGSGAHSLLDLSSHGHEGLLHIGSILSASFQERNAKGISKFLEINQAIISVRTLKKLTTVSLLFQNLVSCPCR